MPRVSNAFKDYTSIKPRPESDLQAFRMFSQHSKWVIALVNSKKVWSIACINYFQVKRALIGKKNWF